MTGTRKVIIHLGDFKAGSTALQTALARNIELLNDHNYDFPDLERNVDRIALGNNVGGNASLLARSMSRVDSFKQSDFVNCIADFRESFSNYSRDLVFSSEWFAHVDLEKFKTLVKISNDAGAHVHGIFFVRDPVYKYVSSRSEQIKSYPALISRKLKNRSQPISQNNTYLEKNFSDQSDDMILPQSTSLRTILDISVLCGGNLSLSVFNFEDASTDIADFFFDNVLNIDISQSPERLSLEKTLKTNFTASSPRQNRSLTDGEEILFKYLNTMDLSPHTRDIIYSNMMQVSPLSDWTKGISLKDLELFQDFTSSYELKEVNKIISGTPLTMENSPRTGVEDMFDTQLRLFALLLKIIDVKSLHNQENTLGINSSHHIAKNSKENMLSDLISSDPDITINQLAHDITARKSRLAYWIDFLDFKFHLWMASNPLLQKSARLSFLRAAERRHRRSYGPWRAKRTD